MKSDRSFQFVSFHKLLKETTLNRLKLNQKEIPKRRPSAKSALHSKTLYFSPEVQTIATPEKEASMK